MSSGHKGREGGGGDIGKVLSIPEAKAHLNLVLRRTIRKKNTDFHDTNNRNIEMGDRMKRMHWFIEITTVN